MGAAGEVSFLVQFPITSTISHECSVWPSQFRPKKFVDARFVVAVD